MKLLAIDTSNTYLSLALSDGENTRVFHEDVNQKHAERTLPELHKLLAESQLALSELDAIVFGQGPGSFTGLRIACGLAQGLAFAANLDVIAIPTLDSIAYQSRSGNVMVCMDARMHQVYCAQYQTGDTWQRIGPIHLATPEEWQAPEGVEHLAGDGFAAYPELLTHVPELAEQAQTSLRPHALAYLELARSGRYPKVHPRDAQLLYIRNKVALTAVEQQASKR